MVKWDPTRKISGKSLQSLGRGSRKRRRKWRQASAQHYGVKEQSTFYVTNAQQLAVLTFHHENSPFARLNYEHINSGLAKNSLQEDCGWSRNCWFQSCRQSVRTIISSPERIPQKNGSEDCEHQCWPVISFSTWLSIRLSTLITYQVIIDFLRTGK
jgi:hypothetical protein